MQLQRFRSLVVAEEMCPNPAGEERKAKTILHGLTAVLRRPLVCIYVVRVVFTGKYIKLKK
jgi:hypothetical protein